jgi:hypothetical protein
MIPQSQQHVRRLRAWIYRRLPVWNQSLFLKKLAGYERRWGLETHGFSKQGFVEVFRRKMLVGLPAGLFYELQAGDGLVGSLGHWLENENPVWRVEAWEHRRNPAADFFARRPQAVLHPVRKTKWRAEETKEFPLGITARGSREASAVCRALREGIFYPSWIGIWNPARRPIWYFRMKKAGFALEMVYERMEFYRGIR